MVKIGELTGRLYDIGLRSTQLKTFDNNLIILPNNFVAESHIINYSKSDPKIRVNIKVSISYESNLEKAKKLLIKVAKSDKNVLKEPEPDVWVNELGDSGIELELKVWIPNAQFRKITPSDLRGKIKKEFDKSGIEIPYPRMYMIDGGKAKRRKKH
jgi:small conductance mechanosensitive channel